MIVIFFSHKTLETTLNKLWLSLKKLPLFRMTYQILGFFVPDTNYIVHLQVMVEKEMFIKITISIIHIRLIIL